MRFPGYPEFATDPPFIRTGWDLNGVTLAQTLALAPPVAVVFSGQGKSLTILVTALLVTFIWELGFALIRRRNLGWHGITTALIFVVLAPETMPILQVVLALSFGTVLGELVFGGRGFGFLNAAAVSLAFLVFSFPEFELSVLSPKAAYACLPGAVLLAAGGIISWRVIVATLFAVLAITTLSNIAIPQTLITPVLVFCLIFMISDPVSASATNGGRWLYGILTGFLIGLLNADPAASITTESLAFSTLLGSIFAPLLDDIVVRLNILRRRRRHG